MHDLDRALQEFESGETFESDAEFDQESDYEGEGGYGMQGEYGEGEYESESDGEVEGEGEYEADSEHEEGEYDGEGEGESGDYEAVFDEMEEMEQAAALLEVQDEEELEQFLGGLIGKVAKKLRKFVPPDLQSALARTLKTVAKTALPKVGAAFGNLVVPGLGGAIGAGFAAKAGKMFGLELEGMSYEDQEFEVARRVVGLGAEATRTAADVGPIGGQSALAAAKDAVIQAAQTHAPGLAVAVPPSYATLGAGAPTPGSPSGRRSGRWMRRGRRIILLGV